MIQYALLTLKHKWFVLIYGLKIGCPVWRLITHDLSKLGPKEYRHHQRQFFGDRGDQLGFQRAWLHHWQRNDHHWEAHIPITRHDRGTPRGIDNEPLPMPKDAVLEMLADWLGASRAYGGKAIDVNAWPWLDDAWPKISRRMHGDTRSLVMQILFKMGRKKL